MGVIKGSTFGSKFPTADWQERTQFTNMTFFFPFPWQLQSQQLPVKIQRFYLPSSPKNPRSYEVWSALGGGKR